MLQKIICLMLLTSPLLVTSSNILFLLPFPGRSQWLFFTKIIDELLIRGHQITAITPFPHSKPMENYTEILIDPPYSFGSFEVDIFNIDMFSHPFIYAWQVPHYGPDCTTHAFENANVQAFMHRNDLQFDLVVIELLFFESWYMFAHQFNAPLIGINTIGSTLHYDSAMGLLTPVSHVSNQYLHFDEKMSFFERFYNAMLSLWENLLRIYYFLPKHNEIARKYFKHLEKDGPLPTVEELEKEISLMLTNDHISITRPRPKMPGNIYIAGAHITESRPLPNDIQTFLDNSPEGVILFSLGSNAQSAKMPKEKLKAFLDAFGTLKQKVLWKYENTDLEKIPPNVMISKWIPQIDVLGHKNVVLFITHGGFFGTIEGAERGIPSLFIPLFADQLRNSLKAIRLGYALMVKFKDVTKETLTSNLKELLTDPKYMENAKKTSLLMKDNPIHPMDEAMFWIEYVIRHKGAKHLKSEAVNLSIFSYLLLDVALVLLVISLVVIFIGYFVTKNILKKLFSNKREKNQQKKAKQN